MPKLPFQLKHPLANVRALYDSFSEPITGIDCGQKCAPHNPGGKPFCCDICHAVPAAYLEEWDFLRNNTGLWHIWHADECKTTEENQESENLRPEMPENMLLLACLGPDRCERPFRALSCRQFPFFPYVTSDYRFVGMTYDWEFEQTCWVVSNLAAVTETYLKQFIDTHDRLFAFSQEAFDSYQIHSEKMRSLYADQARRFPLLHRNGRFYLVSPGSERMTRINSDKLPKFGPYRTLA